MVESTAGKVTQVNPKNPYPKSNVSLKKLAKNPITLTEDGMYLCKGGNQYDFFYKGPKFPCSFPNCKNETYLTCCFEGKKKGCGRYFCYPRHGGGYYDLDDERRLRGAQDCCELCSDNLQSNINAVRKCEIF